MRSLFILFFSVASFSVDAQVWYSVSFDDLTYKNFIFIDTTTYHHNIWQVGKPNKIIFTSAYSAPNSIVTDTLNPYSANDTSVFILKVPAYSLWPGSLTAWGPFLYLSFYYQLNIDTGTKIKVEVTVDTLGSWVDLTQYPLTHNLQWATGLPRPNLDSSTSGWSIFELEYPHILSPFSIHDTILFRFTFISDSNLAHKDGWIMDDIQLAYYFEAGISQIENDNLISIYPNPSKGNIYIHSNKPNIKSAEVSVYNTQGREVYKTRSVPVNSYFDLSLPNGNYTLKYSAGDEFCMKKIVIMK